MAFRECGSLANINVLSNNITSMGDDVFEFTDWYENQKDGLIYINNTLYGYKGEMPDNTSIEIKEGTKCIAACAFDGCSGLTSVNIPDTVKGIGYAAFKDCNKLKKIFIPGSVEIIDLKGWYVYYSLFVGCSSNLQIYTNLEKAQEGWGEKWNFYNLNESLTVNYNTSRSDYELK